MAKRVLITGCSSGIGAALATELSRRGYEVIATARDVRALEGLDVAQRLALDVTSDASVDAAVAAAGEIDVLINNAGMTIWSSVESPDQAEVQRLFDTNVFGMLRMLRGLLPSMRERRKGEIVQISSAVAKRSTALLGHYAATKAAFDAYSEALRLEVAPFGIKVCIVALGAVDSSFGVNRKEIIRPEYADLVDHVKARLARTRKQSWSAESVATRISDAIDLGDLPLRFDGTGDAFGLFAARAALSDEAWEKQTLAEIWNPDRA
jgi:short-subunit dehydrogenase